MQDPPRHRPDPAHDPAHDPADHRPTEDDRARAELGGPKGSPRLQPAPMTPQRAKKTPTTPGDGHPA